MLLTREVEAAEARVRPHVLTTPALHASRLSTLTGCDVFLKMDCWQHTGSFKFRGAINKLLSLTAGQRERGVVTASTGNHGMAVSRAARIVGCTARVFVPTTAKPSKLEGIRALGGQIEVRGDDPVDAELAGQAWAARHGGTWISPYNDPQVAGGQGTLAVELERQLGTVDVVCASLGGGGLLSGVGSWVRHWQPEATVLACSPTNSAVMHHSMEAGRILELESRPTLSDGTAGGVEPDSITFGVCQQVIDRSILVEEPAITEALRWMVGTRHVLVEGAAAMAVAGFRQVAPDYRGKRVVIVLCGANIGLDTLRSVLCDA
jgi:threonine dehydratase